MSELPWQLKLLNKSLKKKLKLEFLKKHVQNPENCKCLLITCGDNNGAMNYRIREWGGEWTWAELEDKSIEEIAALLKEPVVKLDSSESKFPFPDSQFDLVIVIDSHEHLVDPHPFNLEIARILRKGGKLVVSVPNGDERKLAVKIKDFVGMTKEEYGHIVVGYEIPDLSRMIEKVGFKTCSSSTYSKFFTEMLELSINYAYVKVLSKKNGAKVEEGTIAPTTKEQLGSVNKSYKIYSIIYPFFYLLSKLDYLLFFKSGYAVVLEAEKT